MIIIPRIISLLCTLFFLENYRSCLRDCVFARKFKPDHMKAIIRGMFTSCANEYINMMLH